MLRKCLMAAAAILAMGTAAHAQDVNFGIISTESSSNLRTLWTPLLADMEKGTGLKVQPFFATDYAGVIEAMRFNKVQVGWFGNAAAIQAVDRANGEVFVQTVAADGSPGYWSLLLVHKDSPIKSLQDLLASPGKYAFGNGDPNSTSGFLVPSYYVWAENKIDIRKHFTRVLSANHEANALAVANKQVDVATNNTESMDRLKITNPAKFAEIREIWRSPLIPSDPFVWRTDLDAGTKAKVKGFLLAYGTPRGGVDAAEVARERKVLTDLQWAPFKESSNAQLVPVRKLNLFKDRVKIEGDEQMASAEKQQKLAEIDAKLAAIR